MKVNSFNNPSTFFVIRNSSRFPSTVNGPDEKVAKGLSIAMNFKIIETAYDYEGWGHYGPTDNTTTIATYEIATKKVQFATSTGDHITGSKHIAEFAMIGNHFCFLPVVPITKTVTLIIEFTQQCIYLRLHISLLIMLPVIISYILKFEKHSWPPLCVFEAALGFAISREPNKLTERIVFIFTLFAFLMSPSAIYAVFKEFTLIRDVGGGAGRN